MQYENATDNSALERVVNDAILCALRPNYQYDFALSKAQESLASDVEFGGTPSVGFVRGFALPGQHPRSTSY